MNQHKGKYRKILAILFLIGFGYLMIMTQFTTNGVLHIQQKQLLNGKYYIYVNDIQVECSKSNFEYVTVGDDFAYRMTYKSNYFVPGKGTLVTIEYEDVK